MTITMKAWFRALAAAFKSPAPATAVAGLSTLILVLYTGYSVPQPYMIGALRWITWINVSSPVASEVTVCAVADFNLDELAPSVRIRSAHDQRVPHRRRTVRHPGPSRPRVRGRLGC